MAEQKIVQLDPAEIQADDNSRFGLKQSAVEGLAANILSMGEVHTPIGVSLLPKAEQKGKLKYRLDYGFYRHAAASLLNKRDNASVKLPAIIREAGDPTDRLNRMLSENLARQDMSPIDKAVAMKKLIDAGVARTAIRETFSTTVGKRREPMSNAMLNIYLRMLDLPKAILDLIHGGTVGVAAAYELGKVSPEKRQAVIDRAKAAAESQSKVEAADEQKYLAAQKKVEDARAAVIAKDAEAEAAKAGIVQAEANLTAKKLEYEEAKKAFSLDASKDDQAKALEHVKASEQGVKSAEKLITKAKNVVAKLKGEATKAAGVVEGEVKKLGKKGKAKAKPANKKAVGVADVKVAAKAEGAEGPGEVQLSAAEIRQALKDVIKGADKAGYAKVSALCTAIKACFDGKDTPKELGIALAKLTGEAK